MVILEADLGEILTRLDSHTQVLYLTVPAKLQITVTNLQLRLSALRK
jgi:hypothetical protein